MADSAEEIRKHVRVYILVFAALAVLTVVTVGVSYLQIESGGGHGPDRAVHREYQGRAGRRIFHASGFGKTDRLLGAGANCRVFCRSDAVAGNYRNSRARAT